MKLALFVRGSSRLLAGCATGPKPADLAAHHPLGAAVAGPTGPTAGQTDSAMTSMRAMRDTMRAAKTPATR